MACAEIGADPERLTLNRQVHAATVNEAVGGRRGAEGDGLWTTEPGVPLLVLAADCVPIALAATGGIPRLAVLHAGWRGLVDGIVETGVRALGGGEALAAAVGPSIGPCCYEVGSEVSDRFDADLTTGRMLDLRSAVERRLAAAGVSRVEHFDFCTMCHPELFFSHRRDHGVTGRQGVIGVVKS